MAIDLATIVKENLIAVHSSNRTAVPIAVKPIGGDRYQYNFGKQWADIDTGVWEVWTTDTHKVLNDGVGLKTRQKVAEIDVKVPGTAEYIVVVPWDAIASTTKERIVRSSLPPDNSPDWLEWIESNRNWTTMKHRKAFWVRFEDDLAEEIWAKESDIEAPTHGTADQIGDDFNNVLPQDVVIKYKAKLNLQNEQAMEMYFPAGKIKRVEFETLESNGRALGSGGMNINTTATSFNQAVFCGDISVVFVRWKIIYTDDSTYSYIIAVARQ